MRYQKLIYSKFVVNRPENTSMFEVWCLIGGTLCAIFISFDSDTGFMGTPRLESMMSLILPVLYFYINYLSKDIEWMKVFLLIIISLGFLSNLYLYFYPQIPRLELPKSNISLMLFSIVALFLITGNRRKI